MGWINEKKAKKSRDTASCLKDRQSGGSVIRGERLFTVKCILYNIKLKTGEKNHDFVFVEICLSLYVQGYDFFIKCRRHNFEKLLLFKRKQQNSAQISWICVLKDNKKNLLNVTKL